MEGDVRGKVVLEGNQGTKLMVHDRFHSRAFIAARQGVANGLLQAAVAGS
jgi:hypothetical protein